MIEAMVLSLTPGIVFKLSIRESVWSILFLVSSIVDDIPLNVQVLVGLLKDKYEIKVATDGPRALELANLIPHPDLILLDIVMPNMDGYEVLRKLKETQGTKDIPVIVLSDELNNDLIRIMKQIRNSVCLVKPLDFERFKYIVRGIINGYLNLSGGNIIA